MRIDSLKGRLPLSAKKQPTILAIDDEKDLLNILKDILTEENFLVETALTGEKGLQLARTANPDVIILDLKLPDIDGYDVCRELKKSPETARIPVIMLSTRSKEVEMVVGLELGADDYITKPYSAAALLARIRVVLRRKEEKSATPADPATSGLLRHGPIEIDPDTRKVLLKGKEISLTRKEFDLLSLLVSQPGKVFKRQYLMETVWGYQVDSLQQTVDTHIKNLRKKLGSHGKLIETETGVGYRLAL